MKNIYLDFHTVITFTHVVIINLLTGITFTVAAQEYNTGSFTLSIDNDAFIGSDRGYTNGLFLKFNSNSVVAIEKDSPIILKAVDTYLPFDKQADKGWGLTVGQQIWTPTDLEAPFEGENDRPYTGFLFIKANIYEYSADSANKYSLMLGGVGPDALGENLQTSIHQLIGSPKPEGWGRQIENQSVFNFAYEGQKLLKRSVGFDKFYDVGLLARVNIGNYQNEVALGSIIRWGDTLHESFASVGVIPGNYIDPSVLSKSRAGHFYYLALEGRYRINDITIDGARPEHLFDVHTEHWQTTISAGTLYYEKSWGIAFSAIATTPDYEEDLRRYNATASFEIFWRI